MITHSTHKQVFGPSASVHLLLPEKKTKEHTGTTPDPSDTDSSHLGEVALGSATSTSRIPTPQNDKKMAQQTDQSSFVNNSGNNQPELVSHGQNVTGNVEMLSNVQEVRYIKRPEAEHLLPGVNNSKKKENKNQSQLPVSSSSTEEGHQVKKKPGSSVDRYVLPKFF